MITQNKSINQNNSNARKREENSKKNRQVVDVEYYRYSKLIFSFHSVVCFSC